MFGFNGFKKNSMEKLPPKNRKDAVLRYLTGGISITVLAATLNVTESEAKTIAAHYVPDNKGTTTIPFEAPVKQEAYNPFATVKKDEFVQDEEEKAEEDLEGGDGSLKFNELDNLSQPDSIINPNTKYGWEKTGTLNLIDGKPKDVYGKLYLKKYKEGKYSAGNVKMDTEGPYWLDASAKIKENKGVKDYVKTISSLTGTDKALIIDYTSSGDAFLVEVDGSTTYIVVNGKMYLTACGNLFSVQATPKTKEAKPKADTKKAVRPTHTPEEATGREFVTKFSYDRKYKNGDREVTLEWLDQKTETSVDAGPRLYFVYENGIYFEVDPTEWKWKERAQMHTPSQWNGIGKENSGWETTLENKKPVNEDDFDMKKEVKKLLQNGDRVYFLGEY